MLRTGKWARRTARVLAALALLSAGDAVRSLPALACYCASFPFGPPEVELTRHDLVFTGQVVGVRAGGCDSGSIAAFEVEEGFDGSTEHDLVEVEWSAGRDDCALQVEIGDRYLLFLDRATPALSSCTPRLRLGLGDLYSYCPDGAAMCQPLSTLSEAEVLAVLRGLRR